MAVPESQKCSKPRYLTGAEIDDILTVLPKEIRGVTTEIRTKIADQIYGKTFLQLREIQLCPEKIGMFKGIIRSHYYRSLIDPGEPVGITAGEGVGGPITQMTLSGFHQAGSSKNVGSGVDIIRELLNMSQVRKVEYNTIHFINKDLTFDEALEYRRRIVGVSVGSLYRSKEVLVAVETNDRGESRMIDYARRGWWYPSYIEFSGINLAGATHYLRLHMDRNRLYAAGITLSDVCLTLEKQDKSHPIICIPSPSMGITSDGKGDLIIDIYADHGKVVAALGASTEVEEAAEEEEDEDEDEEETEGSAEKSRSNASFAGLNERNADLIFLQQFIVQKLNDFIITGIRGITQIFPQSVKTASLIRSSQPYLMPEDLKQSNPNNVERLKHTWNLWLDPVNIKIKGVPYVKFKQLFELCGFTVLGIPNDPELINAYRGNVANASVVSHPVVAAWKSIIDIHKNTNHHLFHRNQQFTELGVMVIGIPGSRPLLSSLDSSQAELVRSAISPDFPAHFIIETNVEDPLKYLQTMIEDDAKATQKAEQELRKRQEDLKKADPQRYREIMFEMIHATPISRAANYVYVDTNGSNLKDLFAHPDVDKSRTICNNPNEIFRLIGIEAARNFIIRDFYETFTNNGAYVSPRHVIILADFMTNQIPLSITSKGASRQNRGAFSDASFEHAIEALVKSATFGRREDVTATSTCIFMGNRCGFGTGIMKIAVDKAELDKFRQGAEVQPQYHVNPDELTGLVLANSQIIADDVNDEILEKVEETPEPLPVAQDLTVPQILRPPTGIRMPIAPPTGPSVSRILRPPTGVRISVAPPIVPSVPSVSPVIPSVPPVASVARILRPPTGVSIAPSISPSVPSVAPPVAPVATPLVPSVAPPVSVAAPSIPAVLSVLPEASIRVPVGSVASKGPIPSIPKFPPQTAIPFPFK